MTLQQVNWRDIIFDLNRAGLKCAEISRRLKLSRACVLQLKDEQTANPLYSTAVKVLQLHDRVTRGNRT